ncbi:hypothetical protein E4U46_001778 [Claviceps purpurea]|nr:hypothetical protein E4U46_001778 [Claviceps purpurea]
MWPKTIWICLFLSVLVSVQELSQNLEPSRASDRQQLLLEAVGPLSTIEPAESTATTSNAAPPDHESLADELDIGQRIAILFSADDDDTGCVGAKTSKHGTSLPLSKIFALVTMGSQGEHAANDNGKPDLANLGFTPTVHVSGQWEVDKVVDKIPGGRPTVGGDSPLAFFHALERLKTTKREGWRRFGIERGESISDHMYRMSIISMFAPPSLAPRLNLPKCMKMCLIHDMAELLVGDITPVDGVPKPEKSRRESLTMDFLTKSLFGNKHDAAVGQEIRDIWDEYEESKTLDSHYVHDIDKMELLLQMTEYERRAEGALDLNEFAYVKRMMTLPETRAWADELLRDRDAFWADKKQGSVDGEKDAEKEKEKMKLQDEYYARG